MVFQMPSNRVRAVLVKGCRDGLVPCLLCMGAFGCIVQTASTDQTESAEPRAVKIRMPNRISEVLGPEWKCDETTCVSYGEGPPAKEAVFKPEPVASPTPTISTPAGVAVNESALMTNELTIISSAGIDLEETAATAFRASDGVTWSQYVFTQQVPLGGGNKLLYSCSKNYTSWCQRSRTLSSYFWSWDPTTVYQSTGTPSIHMVMLNSALTGFSWYRNFSTDPCPSSCGNSSWEECTFSAPSGFTPDYPQVLWDKGANSRWILYTANKTSTGFDTPALLFRNNCGANTNYIPNCSGWGSKMLSFPRGAFDSSGNLRIVAFDFSVSPTKIFVTTFNQSTSTWNCDYKGIDNYNPPTGTCASCGGTNTYQGIGSCLRENWAANIAVDDRISPNTFIVAETTANGSLEAQTRVFASTNAGSTWFLSASSASNSYQPIVAFYGTPFGGLSGVFHINSVWDNNASVSGSTASEVSWRTTNWGTSWALSTISGSRTPSPVVSSTCYWGDYNAIAPDTGNAGMFYGWGHTATDWTIHGRILNF